jgi:hypothetical protein
MANTLDQIMSAGRTAARETGDDEDACPAFGFLRGLRDRSLTVEFRFTGGHRTAFPYAWLGPIEYDPSHGLLLRFVGDRITLVFIKGSNLNAEVGGTASLFDRGLQRHRVTWVREMTRAELARAGDGDVTIDAIRVAAYAHGDPCPVDWAERFAPPARGREAVRAADPVRALDAADAG